LIIGFEHIADALPADSIFFNETSKVARVVTIVDQFVNMLRFALEDAGTDQWVPLLTFPWLRFTSQSRGRNTKPDLPGGCLFFGELAT
jgi:hypothetical protein